MYFFNWIFVDTSLTSTYHSHWVNESHFVVLLERHQFTLSGIFLLSCGFVIGLWYGTSSLRSVNLFIRAIIQRSEYCHTFWSWTLQIVQSTQRIANGRKALYFSITYVLSQVVLLMIYAAADIIIHKQYTCVSMHWNTQTNRHSL